MTNDLQSLVFAQICFTQFHGIVILNYYCASLVLVPMKQFLFIQLDLSYTKWQILVFKICINGRLLRSVRQAFSLTLM